MKRTKYLLFLICLFVVVTPAKQVQAKSSRQSSWESTAETRRAIEKGLKFLSQAQGKDGSWSQNGNYYMAMTSLSGLAYLSAGHTAERGQYHKNVARCLKWILRSCDSRKLKKLNGLITVSNEGRPMYGHGFAMLFLAQIYGTSSNPEINTRIRDSLRHGVRLISNSQSKDGGWYYNPGDQMDEGSVTITMLQALRASQNVGVTVNKKVIDRSLDYLRRSQNEDGGIRYSLSMGGSGSRPSLAFAGLACYYNCGVYDGKAVRLLIKYIKNQFGYDDKTQKVRMPSNRSHFMYAQHYASQAIFFLGGTFWEGYFKMMSNHLVKAQNSNGSWNASTWTGGQAFGTPVSIMILSLPYRYLPINQR